MPVIVSERNNAAHLFNLPFGDLFPRARHAGEHDADRKHKLELSPDDVHVVPAHNVLRNVFHENWHSLTHLRPLNTPSSAAGSITFDNIKVYSSFNFSRLTDGKAEWLTATPLAVVGVRSVALSGARP